MGAAVRHVFIGLLLMGLAGACGTSPVTAQGIVPTGLVAQADVLLAQGQVAEARALYQKALDRATDPTAAEIGLARADLADENWRRAGNALDAVLQRAPDNIEAHYYRAISHREIAKFHGLLDRSNWADAVEHFEWILARDSLFRDVLYQYAQHRHNAEDHEEAVRLGLEQVRLRPELSEPRRGLFKLYRNLINQLDAQADALAWLAAHPSPYATFFTGEVFRRHGALDQADSVLVQVLAENLLPPQPVLLARARVAYARQQPEAGEAFVRQAIASIETTSHAKLVFEDFKYILSDVELAAYRKLQTPEAYQAFFRTLWISRNPTPAGAVNPRLAEHYRRLLRAEQDYVFDELRAWQNNPDKLHELDLPAVYYLNEEFNDKGLIYIRHGEPVQRIVTPAGDMNFFRTQTTAADKADWLPKDQSFEAGWLPNESWRYYDPDLDFHFVVDEGGGAKNWRLTPALTNYEMVQDREEWGGIYARLASTGRVFKEMREGSVGSDFNTTQSEEMVEEGGLEASVQDEEARELSVAVAAAQPNLRRKGSAASLSNPTLDLMAFRQELVEQSREAVDLGLTTDRHTWAEELEPLEVPYLMAAFRGGEGQTQVEVHFALPIGRLTQEAGAGVRTVDVEVGCALFTADWQELEKHVATKPLPPVPDLDAAVVDYCRMTVPADSYQVAFHNRPVQMSKLGGYKFGYRAPDFSAPGLALSDVLPASAIRTTIGPSRFNRGELYLEVNPFSRFSVNQPLFLYFEVYDLTFGADDLASYTMEFALAPEAPRRRRLGGLFGRGDQPTLTLRAEGQGTRRSTEEFAELDVSSVDPGRYILTVTVTDTHTGESVSRDRAIELTP